MMSLMKTSDVVVGAGSLLLPRVNLLPPEIAEGRRFRRVQMGLGGGVVAAVGVVALLYVSACGSVSTANEQVDAAGAQQRTLQSQTAQYRDVAATYQRTADAQAMLVDAMGQEVRYSRFLNDLTQSIPNGVWLKNVTFTQAAVTAAAPAGSASAPTATTVAGLGTVTLSGVAYQHTDVATWLESLAAQKGYTGPLLQTSTEVLLGTKKVVNWSTTVTLSPEALSGRYPKTGS